MDTWTKLQWGNHIADLVANGEDPSIGNDIQINHHHRVEATEVVRETVETIFWSNVEGSPLLSYPILEARRTRFADLMYTRDEDRRAAGEPDLYHGSPMGYTVRVHRLKKKSIRQRAVRCRIYLDKGMHGRNLLKTARTPEQLTVYGLCPNCKQPDSQRHWVLECANSGASNIREREPDQSYKRLLRRWN